MPIFVVFQGHCGSSFGQPWTHATCHGHHRKQRHRLHHQVSKCCTEQKLISRDHSGYGLSQSEKMLFKCNVSHWLSPYPEWSVHLIIHPSHAQFLPGKIWIYIFAFYIICQYCDCASCWNLSNWNTLTYLYFTVNAMAADVLATQGARASAGMVLTQFFCNIPVSAPDGLSQRCCCIQHWNGGRALARL